MEKISDIPVSINLEKGLGANDEVVVSVRLQACGFFEINLDVPVADLPILQRVRNAAWDRRESLAIGTCANEKVLWCSDEASFTILVGHDDETWDIAARFSLDTLDQIIRESASITSE